MLGICHVSQAKIQVSLYLSLKLHFRIVQMISYQCQLIRIIMPSSLAFNNANRANLARTIYHIPK